MPQRKRAAKSKRKTSLTTQPYTYRTMKAWLQSNMNKNVARLKRWMKANQIEVPVTNLINDPAMKKICKRVLYDLSVGRPQQKRGKNNG